MLMDSRGKVRIEDIEEDKGWNERIFCAGGSLTNVNNSIGRGEKYP